MSGFKKLLKKRQTGDTWQDPQGRDVPVVHINKYARRDEAVVHSLIKEAVGINEKLCNFKEKAFRMLVESYKQKVIEHGINGREFKGNHSITSFDGSVKVSIQVSEAIDFDDMLIDAAQDKFRQFVERNLNDNQVKLGELIMSAFEKRGGNFDPKRVLALYKFRESIKDKLFQEALELLDKSTRAAGSKQYVLFMLRDDKGEYQRVPLNFSAI